MAVFEPRRGCRIANRDRARRYRIVGYCLFAGLVGLVPGCGGGTVAPVYSPSEPPIPGLAREHIVGKGDTVYSIAWRHGLDYRVLARANAIREPFTIFPGQRILIPEPDGTVPSASDSSAATSEPPAQGEVSIQALKVRPALKPTRLLSPPPKPASELPAGSSRKVPQTAPKSSTEPPRKIPPKAAAPTPQSVPRQSTGSVEAQRTNSGAARSRWRWPTKGKTVGFFARGGGKGIDITGVFDQPIHAAARGRVVYAGSGLVGYGKLIILKHDNRLLSAYAHNESLHVKEGEAVKGGQHIADMGRSGRGRVMLHFEIRRNGKPIDPFQFLPR